MTDVPLDLSRTAAVVLDVDGTIAGADHRVSPRTSRAMVEVRAHRDGGELHNFAAHLIGVAAGRITRMWMVEAKPAASDAFWG